MKKHNFYVQKQAFFSDHNVIHKSVINLVIKKYSKIQNKHIPKEFMNTFLVLFVFIHATVANWLCDTDRWNQLKGNWVYNSANCVLSNTDAGEGNVIWFGDITGKIPDSTFNSFGAFLLRVDISVAYNTNDGKGGILFRARNVSSVNDHGEQYWLALQPSGDKILLAKIDDGVYTVIEEYFTSISFDTTYNILIESIPNNFTFYKIYLEDSLLFIVELNDFIDGSIGFRTYNGPTTYSNLNYNGTLLVPTFYPTFFPS